MKQLIYFVMMLFLVSCNDHNLTTSSLTLRFDNQASRAITVYVYPVIQENNQDTLWFSLSPGHRFKSDVFISEEFLPQNHEIVTFQPEIYPVFFFDSVRVHFADSLDVIHYSRAIPFDSLTSSSKPLFYLEQRNIFNFDNYSVQKVGEYNFEATYTFTEADLHYADSTHQ